MGNCPTIAPETHYYSSSAARMRQDRRRMRYVHVVGVDFVIVA